MTAHRFGVAPEMEYRKHLNMIGQDSINHHIREVLQNDTPVLAEDGTGCRWIGCDVTHGSISFLAHTPCEVRIDDPVPREGFSKVGSDGWVSTDG